MPVKRQTPTSRVKPGSQSALRRRNGQLIIETLARRGPTTQATLSRVTGLSTGTVSNLVKLLEQNEIVSATPTIDSGRRALAIGLRAGGSLVAGVDIDRTQVRVVICALDQTVLVERSSPLDKGHSPQHAVPQAARLVDEALAAEAIPRSKLVGVGISIAAAIEHDSTLLAPDTLLPNWEGVSITKLAARAFNLPCFVDNDANLGALAQVSFGPFKDVTNLAFIKLSVGIGAGLILNRELIRGAMGIAGEIGHTLVSPYGEPCRCGNRGCLETVASTAHIAAAIGRAVHAREPLDDDAVVEIARRRDPAALRVLADAGNAIGIAVASLCSIVNPAVVVIGGSLAPVGAPLLDPIYRAFHRQSLPEVGRRTTLMANQLGVRTEALGAAALAIRQTPVALI